MTTPPTGILWAVPIAAFPATNRLPGPVKERCHHITLGIGPLTPLWEEALGTRFQASILADCWSVPLGVQAYKMRLPDNILALATLTPEQKALGGFNPHLTLFTGEGVSAFESNSMRAETHIQSTPPVDQITCTIEFCPDDQKEARQTSHRLR